MRRMLIHLLVSVSAIGASSAARGADGPELTPLVGPTLPMPAAAPPAVVLTPGPVSFYRPNRMDVWQYYAVDRTGHWRPRVALTGAGAFYLYNGAPYPMLPLRQTDVLPYILD